MKQLTSEKPAKQGLQKQIKNGKKAPEYVNVNSYKHFLALPATNEHYIKWAFGLRQHEPLKGLKGGDQAPATAYKTIQALKVRHQTNEIEANINISQFEHLAVHRLGGHPSAALLKFETGLRGTKSDKQLLQRERKWVSIPRRDRHEPPKLLASSSLKKKVILAGDLEVATDGQQNYPSFSEKIVSLRNANSFRHMMRGKIHLPTIGWQTSLRGY